MNAATTSNPKPQYRYFIQAHGRKEYAHKNYHYQATATSLKELWAKIGAQLSHFDMCEDGYTQLTSGIRRDLKASMIVDGKLFKIGCTSDGKAICVHRVGESKDNPLYYWQLTPKGDGQVQYRTTYMWNTGLYGTPGYDVEKITCAEYYDGCDRQQRQQQRDEEAFAAQNAPAPVVDTSNREPQTAAQEEKYVCALCGKEHEYTGAWRRIYKRGNQLMDGYYKPRLSEQEMYMLAWGEMIVCTNRQGCQHRRMSKAS